MNKLLIIGQVWPEPTSSAAGTRMIQLIDCFKNAEFEITFACAASKSDFSFELISKNVNEVEITLNDGNKKEGKLISASDETGISITYDTKRKEGKKNIKETITESIKIEDIKKTIVKISFS